MSSFFSTYTKNYRSDKSTFYEGAKEETCENSLEVELVDANDEVRECKAWEECVLSLVFNHVPNYNHVEPYPESCQDY